jgi:hypothetical protein
VVVGGYSITKGYFNNGAKTNEVYKVWMLDCETSSVTDSLCFWTLLLLTWSYPCPKG